MSNLRRRRSGRQNLDPHRHHQESLPTTPEQWPSGREVATACDLDALAAAALALATADDVLKVLRTMPAMHRQYVLGALGLRTAATVNRGMAAQLLARVRADKRTARSGLLRDITTPISALLDHRLDPDQWTAMLGPDHRSALDAYAEAPDVLAVLYVAARAFSPALRTAGLAAAIARDTAASAIALALLATEHETARAAHTHLRESHPGLPAIPHTDLADLLPPARLAALGMHTSGDIHGDALADILDELPGEPGEDLARSGGAGTADKDEGEEVMTGDPQDCADSDGDGHPTTDVSGQGSIEDPLAAAEQVLAEWTSTSDMAVRVAAALRDDRLPDAGDLAGILRHAETGTTATAGLRAALGHEVAATRTGLRAAADSLARHRAAAADAAWLRRLADLTGPASLRDAIEAVHTAAGAALADASASRAPLDALRHLIELGAAARNGEPVDFAALAEAQAVALDAWPAITPLVAAAAAGLVTLPDQAAAPAEDGASEFGTASTAAGVPPEVPAALVSRPGSAGPTPLADSTPADDGAGTLKPVKEPTHNAETEQAVQASPASDAQPDGPADLSDLDELLNAGASAVLAAVSSRRTRTRRDAVEQSGANGTGMELAAGGAVTDDAPPQANGADGADDAAGVDAEAASAALLSARRFGLAADLLEAANAPTASVAARRLAAYASALSAPTGHLASAFAELAPEVSREALGDDRAGQLVALCAAARVALLAPSAGPAKVLLDLLPCVSEQHALTEALTALADASRTGIVVLPEAADAVGTLAAAETAAAEAANSAAELLAVRRRIKYIPANGVYQAWMSSTGPLGAMLMLVATNNADAVSTVRDSVINLRGKGEKNIDNTFAEQSRNRSNRIVGGARGTLLARWDEAVDLAARWADLAERAAERNAAIAAGAWQAGPLTKLRRRLAEVRDPALDELAVRAGGDPAITSAAEAAGTLLAEAIAICDGAAPDPDEPPVAFAAHAELLASALPLTEDTLLPDGGLSGVHLPALLAVATTGRSGPGAVYTQRAEHGDHDLTAALIAGVRPTDPAIAAALERQRSADIIEQAAHVAGQVATLTTRIDTRRLVGALDDQPWAALAARAEALGDPARRDFGRILAAIEQITTELDAHQEHKIGITLARIDERARDNQVVAESAERLADLARRGHIASADEYLETALSGGALPSATASVGEESPGFFPNVPRLAGTHPMLLTELRDAFAKGRSGAASTWMVTAGLDPGRLSEPRRAAGQHALDMWAVLRDRGSGVRKVDVTTALRAVLAQAGLEFADAKREQTRTGQTGRQWVRLSGVTGTGDPLTPVLGSAMSPDGTTLRVVLVRSAPTPSTLIEWLSSEPPDHTVLALWLAGALTPADWRAIADAARGRPNPPLLLLDEAALAYLVCRGEPRRTTFAAIALPFTAASPYRDTPGDTAPEMFYGRTEELAAVVDLAGPSFVSGGRQLGKSALLRVAARRFEAAGPGRHAVLTSVFTVGGDGRPERLWAALWPHLAELGVVEGAAPAEGTAEVVHAAVLRWLSADPARALLVLLDEADAFLDADAAGNRFTHVDWCRKIMLDSDRRAKVVFAGLHRTARFESLPNQPLSHLGRPISVGPLRPQHAHDLLTRPLAALGFEFDDPIALPARVLAMANNMPALLQLFGQALVKHLTAQPVQDGGPPQLITDVDVDEVFADTDLRTAFRDKYVLTLNLDHRYLVIAYAVAAAAHEHGIDTSLSLVELSESARRHWPAGFSGVGADDFRGLVTECVDLGVLALDSGRYRLRTPRVLRLLGTEEEVLETLYTAPERLEPPSVSDAGSYRRRVGGLRSPLTERQLGRLFDARREVLTVTGSTALGVEAVLGAVEAAHAEGAHLIGAVAHCGIATPHGVRAAVARTGVDGTLLLTDGRTLTPTALTALLTAAEEAVTGARPDVTVAVVCSPVNAAAWVGRAARIDLTRIDEPGLRMWCDEDNLPFRDDASRAELLATTGGWPWVVARATHLSAAATPTAGSGKVLSDLRAWLTGDGQHPVSQAAIGPGTPALAEVFSSVADLAGPHGEDPEDLAELLELDERVNLAMLTAKAGFGSVGDAVAALTALGCLIVTDTGAVRPEPVLAAFVAGTDSGTMA